MRLNPEHVVNIIDVVRCRQIQRRITKKYLNLFRVNIYRVLKK